MGFDNIWVEFDPLYPMGGSGDPTGGSADPEGDSGDSVGRSANPRLLHRPHRRL